MAASASILASSTSGLIGGKILSISRLSTSSLGKTHSTGRSIINKIGSVRCPVFGSAGGLKAVCVQHTVNHGPAVVRSEASDGGKSNSLDIWLGRVAMLGFVGVVAVEMSTGKGVLENAGLTTPLPTFALTLTAVVGVVTAFGIFRSGNDNS